MSKSKIVILILSALLISTSEVAADQEWFRIYLVNNVPGKTIHGRCSTSKVITAKSNEHPMCYSRDASFKIGLSTASFKTLSVTNEGNFSITLSGGEILAGAVETVWFEDSGRKSCYVYVWTVKEGGK